MNLREIKPYTALWIAIPVMAFISWLNPNATYNLQYHEIFFVISMATLSLWISGILGILGLLYWLMRNQTMVLWMKLFHVGVTIGILTTFHMVLLVRGKLYDLGFSTIRDINHTLTVLILLFIFSQMVLVVNTFIGLKRRK